MDRVKVFLFFLTFFSYLNARQGLAQRVIIYDFMDGLTTTSDSAPSLQALEPAGKFVKEVLPELGNDKRPVYQFEANGGLQFSNEEAFGILNRSYTIEIYFKLTDLDSWKRVLDFKNRKSDNGCYIYEGKLNFFNFATGEKAPVKPNKYIHYVFSRDIETHQIKMYVDGESRVEFLDPGDEATLGEDQVLNFFQDDLVVGHESSGGAVALIRIYNRVMTPVFIRQSFKRLAQNIQSPPPSAPQKTTNDVLFAKNTPDDPPGSTERVAVSGKVFNGGNLDFLDEVDVIVRRINGDSIIARARTIKGKFKVLVPPYDTYRITAQNTGFQTKSIIVSPKTSGAEVETLVNMEEENFNKPIFIIPFTQSDFKLTDASLTTLDSLVEFMKSRPDLTIKLFGHTDNVGEFEKNIVLSRQRNSIVQDYLLQKGIEATQLEMKGFGPTRPIASNNSETNRQLNRRVEVWAEPIKR